MKYLFFTIFFGIAVVLVLIFQKASTSVPTEPTSGPSPTLVLASITPIPSRVPTIVPTTTTVPVTTVNESSTMSQSSSSEWWVSSGGRVFISGDSMRTILGNLPSSDRWYGLYKESNPEDTDDGSHPQNIFRLVTKDQKIDNSEQVYFKIHAINLSQSENRNESNGVLLFNRYQNSDNVYYAGIRVDGAVVIKRKILGEYQTLAVKKIISGTYNRNSNPNLLQTNTWYGLKTIVKNEGESVRIILYLDTTNSGSWKELLNVLDSKPLKDGMSLHKDGHGGIRTDFMDVEFRSFEFNNL